MQEFDDIGPQQRQSHLEDPELAHVVSLSLKVCISQLCFLFFLIGGHIGLFKTI